jgi:hypothetical protein
MNINDVYFGKSDTSFDVHVKVASMLTLTFQFNICTLFILREIFALMWLEIWDSLHTLNAR